MIESKIDLTINKMTKAKYEELLANNQIVDTELYLITDDNEVDVDSYSKAETDQLLSEKQNTLTAGAGITISGNVISASVGLDIEVILSGSLPETGDPNTIYLLAKSAESPDRFDEYIYVTSVSKWEKIGSTQIDLTNYYTKTEVDALIPTVPTKTSELTNDSGFLTEHQSLENYYTKTETYSQTEVNGLLDNKADKTSVPNIVYSETEPENPVEGMIWLKPTE